MRTRKASLYLWFGSLIGCLLIAASILRVAMFFSANTFDPGLKATAEDVRAAIGVRPPAQAKEIRLAKYESQNSRILLIRFVAPIESCMDYAKAITPGIDIQPLTFDQKNLDLGIVSNASAHMDVKWFDLPYRTIDKKTSSDISESPGMVGSDIESPPLYAIISVRVDRVHGVCYILCSN